MPETDTPFWEQDSPAAAGAQEKESAGPSDSPWEGPAIDPDTGTWRPILHGDPFMIGEHEFRWSEGPIATANFYDGEGNELGIVHVPFDPETQQPDDDLLKEAENFFRSLEYLRKGIRQDAIDALEPALHQSGPGENGGGALSEIMISVVAEALQGNIRITVTDDDEEGLTPDQLHALSAECERIFDAHLPDMVRGLAAAPAEEGLTFWQKLAREMIATATLHARDVVAEEWGGMEAVQALGDEEFAVFEEQVNEAYRTGPYLAAASLSLSRTWIETLGELVSAVLQILFSDQDSDDSKHIATKVLREARKSLGLPVPPENADNLPTPTLTPVFDADGYGRTDNSIISIGARRALSAGQKRWQLDLEAWPVFTHENGSGQALYSPSRLHFPTARDAMRAVDSYGPDHVAMLKYITAQHLANAVEKTSGPYGGFYLGIEDFLAFRGIKKHSGGGYRPEDRRAVVELVEALECIEVTGSIERHEQGKGRRGRKTTLTIRSPLIVVSHRVTQPSMLDGTERPIAWYLRAGDWAAELERYGLQYAVTTKALLQLHPQNDRHAFDLGNHLTEQYRIRANQQNWSQPYRVCTILEGAEIEVDRKNPGRFRKRIEAALDVLTSPHDMQETPIIERWQYAQTIEPKGRGWLDRWLESGIIITPPARLIQPYASLRRGHPRKLAS